MDIIVEGGSINIGGLVGHLQSGEIKSSSSIGDIRSGHSWIGGLVGLNSGNISQSWASGNASGLVKIGGLVGHNTGNISQSWASGNAYGTGSGGEIGGLVGLNTGNISQSWTNGTVTGTRNNAYVGGLIGHQERGTITQTWNNSSVSSGGSFIGGLIGLRNSRRW